MIWGGTIIFRNIQIAGHELVQFRETSHENVQVSEFLAFSPIEKLSHPWIAV